MDGLSSQDLKRFLKVIRYGAEDKLITIIDSERRENVSSCFSLQMCI